MDFEYEALFGTFVAEAQDNLAAAESGLLALEVQPDDKSHVDQVFRAVHTLKGNSSSLGFRNFAEFAHALEDVLDGVRRGRTRATAGLVTLLLRAVDVMKGWLPALQIGTEDALGAEAAALLERVQRFRTEGEAAPAAVADGGNDRPAAAEARPMMRVEAARMDALLDLAGEMTIAAERLRRNLDSLPLSVRSTIADSVEQSERLLHSLNETVMKCRMVPVGPIFQRYQRTVRDAAAATGKNVQLIVSGGDVEVDMTVAEALTDPLVHLVRNAVDHGIEAPAQRAVAGKPSQGIIHLAAQHERGAIVVTIRDDGGGIRRDKIRDRALASGIDVAGLSDAQLIDLTFAAGFSTADRVTGTSGRGIGLDVVRRGVEKIRGDIQVESREGEGTTMTLRLPLTLAVIPGFVVAVGGEQFVLPLADVDECLDRPSLAATNDRTGLLHIRGEAVPFLRLGRFFELGSSQGGRELAVIVDHHRGRAGLIVDEIIGESQIVIKPLGAGLRSVAGIGGTAVMGTGTVAMVLDPAAIFREIEKESADVA